MAAMSGPLAGLLPDNRVSRVKNQTCIANVLQYPRLAMKPIVKNSVDRDEFYFVEGCFITELSNSDDDPEVSIARSRVVPGATTRWHRLSGTTERYVIIEGQGRVEVEGLSSREVSEGDVVIIPPLSPQRISNTGAADLVFLAICSPRFVEDAYESL